MRRGEHAAAHYTKGWEVFGNFLSMTRTSVTRHVLMSLVVGFVIGLLWFRSTLGTSERSSIGGLVRCTLASELRSADRLGDYPAFGGSLTHRAACAEARRRLGGRTLKFLGQQAALHGALCALTTFVLLGGLLSVYGRSLRKGKHVRGTRVVDWADKTKTERRRHAVLWVTFALVAGSLSMSYTLGTDRLLLLDDFVTSAWCVASERVARFLSIDGGGDLVWFTGIDTAGFRAPSQMLAWAEESFDGRSLPWLFFEWWVHCAVLGLLPIPVLLAKRIKVRPVVSDIVIGGVAIPRKVELYHFLFCGSPGSGKSTAIKSLLDQVRTRREKAVVYDCSGEYISAFYRPGHDIILNPLDARSARWDIWNEARRPEDFYSYGRSLFPQEGKDPFWADAGAQLFCNIAATLQRQGRASNQRMGELLLRAPLSDLHAQLKGTPGARFMDPAAGAMPNNVLATVAAKMGAWDLLADPTQRSPAFSIRRFIESTDDRWLFLSTREDQHDVLKPLLSLWCDITTTSILSLPPSDNPIRKWVILDEVASLQRLAALPQLLQKARKHGGVGVLGLQSIAQLRLLYSRDGAAALTSYAQTWLCLRSVEPDTARWLEDSVGVFEQEETQESISMGPGSMRDGVSLQNTKRKEPVILAGQFQKLPDLTGYLSRPNDDHVYRVSYGFRHRDVVAPGFVDLHATTRSDTRAA